MSRATRKRVYAGPQHVPEQVQPSGLSNPETNFLLHMDKIARAQKDWNYHCEEYAKSMQRSTSKFGRMMDGPAIVFDHNRRRAEYLDGVRTVLMDAGKLLGFNPRFDVTVDQFEQLHIKARNGSGERLLTRYECLVTMRELGRD